MNVLDHLKPSIASLRENLETIAFVSPALAYPYSAQNSLKHYNSDLRHTFPSWDVHAACTHALNL
jgi:hypothetical protein